MLVLRVLLTSSCPEVLRTLYYRLYQCLFYPVIIYSLFFNTSTECLSFVLVPICMRSGLEYQVVKLLTGQMRRRKIKSSVAEISSNEI